MINQKLDHAEIKRNLFKPHLEASTLPGEFYYKQKYYEYELEHIFSKKWICVGRADEIPEAGDYLTETIGNIPVIIVRNNNNELKAHINVCRHRGCQIVEESGRTKAFKCPYHGWLYSLDGELRGTPDFDNTKNFDKKDFSLRSASIEVWEGFILINLDPNATSFSESISDIYQIGLDKYGIGNMRTYKRLTYKVNCNWKGYVENAMEYYHVPWVHPITFQANTPMNIWKEFPDLSEQDWLLMVGQEPGASYSESGEALLHVPEELATLPPEFDGMPIMLFNPSLILLPVADCLIGSMIIPLGPEETLLIKLVCIHEEDYLKVENGDEETINAINEYMENIDTFQHEDIAISEKQHKGFRSNSIPGRYSRHEALMHKFDKWVYKTAYEPSME